MRDGSTDGYDAQSEGTDARPPAAPEGLYQDDAERHAHVDRDEEDPHDVRIPLDRHDRCRREATPRAAVGRVGRRHPLLRGQRQDALGAQPGARSADRVVYGEALVDIVRGPDHRLATQIAKAYAAKYGRKFDYRPKPDQYEKGHVFRARPVKL